MWSKLGPKNLPYFGPTGSPLENTKCHSCVPSLRMCLVPLPTFPHCGTNFCVLGCFGGGPNRPKIFSLVTVSTGTTFSSSETVELNSFLLFFIMLMQ